MHDLQARALLREALALFNDHPNFGLRSDRRATSYRLASRIEAFLVLPEIAFPGREAGIEGAGDPADARDPQR